MVMIGSSEKIILIKISKNPTIITFLDKGISRIFEKCIDSLFGIGRRIIIRISVR